MSILTRMLLGLVIPAFLIAQISFGFIVVLADLFSNITTYIVQRTSLEIILKNTLFNLPNAVYMSLPTSYLFAISFAMGTLYSQNELISVFSSGISLKRFVKPILLFGLILSLLFFIFTEFVQVPATKAKNTAQLISQNQENSINTDVTLISNKGQIIYNAAVYEDKTQVLTNVLIVYRDKDFQITKRIDGLNAKWNGKFWTIEKARIFELGINKDNFNESFQDSYEDVQLNEKPETFRRNTIKVAESNVLELFKSFNSLREVGLAYRDIEVEFYKRFAFALAPFGVALLASFIGGRFKKNIILLCLGSSLGVSIVYFVIQMLGEVFGKVGILPPFLGSFLGIIIVFSISIYGIRKVKN